MNYSLVCNVVSLACILFMAGLLFKSYIDKQRLKNDLKSKELSISMIQNWRRKSEDKVKELESELDDTKKELYIRENTSDSHLKKVNELKLELKKLEADDEFHKSKIDYLVVDLDKAVAQRNDYRKELSRCEQVKNGHLNSSVELRSQLEELKKENQKLHNAGTDALIDRDKWQREVTRLQDLMKTTVKQLNATSNRILWSLDDE